MANQQQTIFLGHLQTARTIPTDSTFNNFYINMTQRKLSYFEYISKPVLSYFDLSKEVELALLLLPASFISHRYVYFYLNNERVDFCHLWWFIKATYLDPARSQSPQTPNKSEIAQT